MNPGFSYPLLNDYTENIKASKVTDIVKVILKTEKKKRMRPSMLPNTLLMSCTTTEAWLGQASFLSWAWLKAQTGHKESI